MVDNPHYRAFISYSHSDQKTARWLHRAIENYRVPKTLIGAMGAYGVVSRRLGKVFRDEEELAGAAELGPQLENPLRASDALIVICSPKAAKSRWVDHEIRFFKRVNPGKPVLAVIADGEPSGENNCFPESLLYGVTPEGEIDRGQAMEPLAPDLQKMDHSRVKLKLIAGLLGVQFDDLARRDLKRSRGIAALVATGTTTVIIALATLSTIAFIYAGLEVKAKNEETRQRKIAEANLEQALKSQALAEMAAEACKAGAGAKFIPDTPADCAATQPLPADLGGPVAKTTP